MEKNSGTYNRTQDGFYSLSYNRSARRYFTYGFYWHNNATPYCANHISHTTDVRFYTEEAGVRTVLLEIETRPCYTKADAMKEFRRIVKQPEVKALIKAKRAWVKGA